MWLKLTFRFFAENKKIAFLRSHGIMLGTRYRNGRKLFLYMLKDFFVEVTYQMDDIDQTPEKIDVFSNLTHLNHYLERDFRTAF